eukprot:3476981-Prymnesium_polylepis.1
MCSAPRPGETKIGERAVIKGLTARSDLNGASGKIIGQYDAVDDRWPVKVRKEKIRVTTANLQMSNRYSTPYPAFKAGSAYVFAVAGNGARDLD